MVGGTIGGEQNHAVPVARNTADSRVRAAFDADSGPYLVPAGILAEITYIVEQRLGLRTLDLFLEDQESGAYITGLRHQDLACIRALITRYANLPLRFADASVMACAERSGGQVLTLDVRDFAVVARTGRVTILPD